MKRLMNILLIACLTAGVFHNVEAQRNRNNGESSRGERRETNVSAQRGERFARPNVSQVRSFRENNVSRNNSVSGNNSFGANQRNERSVAPGRLNNNRIERERNVVARNDIRENNRVNVTRQRNESVNSVASVYDRNRGVSRYNNPRYNNSSYNSYRSNRNNGYNGNYRYNSRYYGGGYYNFNNRRYSFMYGPRYTVIPRNYISIHFGGYPYYYNDGFFYGYYSGYYQPIFPPVGIRIGFLPFGYSTLFIGGYPYYYYNGIYYRPYDDNYYEVVDPPMGATVYSLPRGAKSVILNGEKMYELNGTYYKEDRNSKGQVIYIVVGKNGEINNTDNIENDATGNNGISTPPASLKMGDIVNQLPAGSKVVTIDGEKIYVAPDDTYLKEESDGGVVQYRVVGKEK